ncbi:hypothetical protein ACNRBH_00720 [Ralstonia pseudosolanacearum]|uniref:hypothetical protein n=1 Tax=Ralstonia pseudosolanacearum TaxID=1310165 RepID=UPI003AAB7A0D
MHLLAEAGGSEPSRFQLIAYRTGARLAAFIDWLNRKFGRRVKAYYGSQLHRILAKWLVCSRINVWYFAFIVLMISSWAIYRPTLPRVAVNGVSIAGMLLLALTPVIPRKGSHIIMRLARPGVMRVHLSIAQGLLGSHVDQQNQLRDLVLLFKDFRLNRITFDSPLLVCESKQRLLVKLLHRFFNEAGLVIQDTVDPPRELSSFQSGTFEPYRCLYASLRKDRVKWVLDGTKRVHCGKGLPTFISVV